MMIRTMAALFVLAHAAHATPDQTRAGAETHDGFFLRSVSGLGVMTASVRLDGTEVSLGGSGRQLEVSLGGALSEGLIAHADLFSSTSRTLSGTRDGADVTFDTDSLNLLGAGVGVTWFVQPQNIYLSGSVFAAFLQLPNDLISSEAAGEAVSQAAGMARVLVGKEWWVSANWGLGIAVAVHGGIGQGTLDSGATADSDFDLTFGGASLLFSATFN